MGKTTKIQLLKEKDEQDNVMSYAVIIDTNGIKEKRRFADKQSAMAFIEDLKAAVQYDK